MKLDKITLAAALVMTLSAAAQAPNLTAQVPENKQKQAGSVCVAVAEPEAGQLTAVVRTHATARV